VNKYEWFDLPGFYVCMVLNGLPLAWALELEVGFEGPGHTSSTVCPGLSCWTWYFSWV
jgi:hypothetical protein